MKGIVVKETGFVIVNGGLQTSDIDSQTLNATVITTPGQSGNSPFLGVGIMDFVNAPKTNAVLNKLKKRIKLNLKLENYKQKTVNVKGFPNVNIDAYL